MRQKYKDEAKAAKERCELLEQRLKLVAQLESKAPPPPPARAPTSAAAENESLKAQLEKAPRVPRLQGIQRIQAIAGRERAVAREGEGGSEGFSVDVVDRAATTTTTRRRTRTGRSSARDWWRGSGTSR